ncbi:MAG: agmatinase family protein, partial [Actinomycetota bacterium]|nr:agmatinase family protein [Actinomycetota bacterium]
RSASFGAGAHLAAGVDALAELEVVDFGDAPVVPADVPRSRHAIEATVAAVVRAGVVPIVLGGDHSITEANVRACAAVHGALGLVHLDTHTDTAREVFGVEVSHGTPMYRLVEGGLVDPRRYVQIGLRGYWPGESEFAWQRERGITAFFMHDVRASGLPTVLEETIGAVAPGPCFVSVDVDVLDPAFAPGTGTPEPGGMTPAELLDACRILVSGLDVVGADVVEVAPVAAGTADVTALVADRVAREILTGIALRRRSGSDGA